MRRLIAREVERGVPSSRIFLAGFSQGGAVAYTAALTHPEPLGGAIALSTYLPSSHIIVDQASTANRSIRRFAGHGTEYDVVSIELGQRAKEFLLGQRYKIEWHTYPISHTVCLEEVRDVGRWVSHRLTPGHKPAHSQNSYIRIKRD